MQLKCKDSLSSHGKENSKKNATAFCFATNFAASSSRKWNAKRTLIKHGCLPLLPVENNKENAAKETQPQHMFMPLSLGQNRLKTRPENKERTGSAHIVVISQPSQNFSNPNKVKIQSRNRNLLCKMQQNLIKLQTWVFSNEIKDSIIQIRRSVATSVGFIIQTTNYAIQFPNPT